MKKTLITLSMMMCAAWACAQNIYEVAEMAASDLNGTARYVGMGGAMSSLGGDISTMSSNPAAIGLYRRGDVAVTGSLVTQPGGVKFDGNGKTHASFDQLGFVYATPIGESSLQFINFGVNYHKMRDFNQLVEVNHGDLSGADYASQTMQMARLSNYWGGPSKATPLAYMGRETWLIGLDDDDYYSGYSALGNAYNKARWGSNQAFDFNVAANINDQLYIGLTATGYNVYQKNYSLYSETLATNDLDVAGSYTLENSRKLDGSGFDAKLGVIVRPIRTSNFKIGVSVATPTYYDLHCSNEASLYARTIAWGNHDYRGYHDSYDYKIRTPWKFGVSVANTFFNCMAIDAEYEYADYSSCSVSYGDEYDDWYDGSKDRALNRSIDKFLKGTHTLKVGAEVNFAKFFYVRGGYNFVTSSIDKDAYYNQYINSASVDAATSTDFMNLSSVNRFSAGAGVKYRNFYADFAWMHQAQHGDFYAFATQSGEISSNHFNECPGSRVKLNKTQLMLTLGYKF